MKKLLTLVMVVFFVVCGAGNALAAFESTTLNLVVFNDSHELHTNIGNALTLDFGASQPLGTVNTTELGTGSWEMQIIGASNARNEDIFATNTMIGLEDLNTAGLGGYQAQVNMVHIFNGIRAPGADSLFFAKSTTTNTYTSLLNYGGTNMGVLAGALDDGSNGIAEWDGVITQYLSHWQNGVFEQLGTVTINTATGVVNYNPVPIPGALVLFASGLIGLIGIRRKNA